MSNNSETTDRNENVPSTSTKSFVTADQKKYLIKYYEDGYSLKESAEISGINYNTAKQIMRNYRMDGEELIERKRGGSRRVKVKLTAEVLDKIERIVECNPKITLIEIKKKLAKDGIQIGQSTIHNGLMELRITLKLTIFQIEKMNEPSTINKRKLYAEDLIKNAPVKAKNWIFLDECEFMLHLSKSKTKSKTDAPENMRIPTRREKNTTLIVAMNDERILHFKVFCQSKCNSPEFCVFLRELLENLSSAENMESSWVILDNAKIHKAKEVENIVEESSHTLKFLPPYSPMLNPVENVFSKLKMNVRNRLTDPDINCSLVEVIQECIQNIKEQDLKEYIKNMRSKLPQALQGEIIT